MQLFYTAQSALAYSVGNASHGLANNGMTDAQRAALSPDDLEYQFRYVSSSLKSEDSTGHDCQLFSLRRVIGSQIQVAGWTTYSALIWSFKLSMLAFYIRLTV